MGHSRDIRFVTAEQAETVGIDRSPWGGAVTLPERAVRYAVREWFDEYHDADARNGAVTVTEGTNRDVAEHFGFDAVRDGESVAVPVYDKVKSESFRFEHTLTDGERQRSGFDGFDGRWLLQQLAEKKYGPVVVSSLKATKLKARPLAEARGEGKLVTKYRVELERGYSDMPSADTLTEAKKAARALALANPGVSVNIIPERVLDTKESFYSVTAEPHPEGAAITISGTRNVPAKGAKLLGWMVGFDYHH